MPPSISLESSWANSRANSASIRWRLPTSFQTNQPGLGDNAPYVAERIGEALTETDAQARLGQGLGGFAIAADLGRVDAEQTHSGALQRLDRLGIPTSHEELTVCHSLDEVRSAIKRVNTDTTRWSVRFSSPSRSSPSPSVAARQS